MKKYLVEYEVRYHNAIGNWWLFFDYIEAEGLAEALTAFRDKWADKYDFRFPSRCEEIAK